MKLAQPRVAQRRSSSFPTRRSAASRKNNDLQIQERCHETVEPRLVFDLSLAPGIELNIDTTTDIVGSLSDPQELPGDIVYHVIEDDFRYSSESLDPDKLDEFIKTTEGWQNDPIPIDELEIDADNQWWKAYYINPISIHEDGYIVAERRPDQLGVHTLIVTQKPNSDCFASYGHSLKTD